MTAQAIQAQLVVLGSGPGGYAAAFRAADCGLNVVLVEQYETLGGVCLNVGCIPSKALLHVAEVINSSREMAEHGLTFGAPKLDIAKIRAWKDGIVTRLTGGLLALSKQRKVTVVKGRGEFTSSHEMVVTSGKDKQVISFESAIIAAGSRSMSLPFIPQDPRIFDSTGALELAKVDGSLLVLGGGIIGCEMATVYQALGAKVTIIEMIDQLMPGADRDIVKPCQKIMESRGMEIHLGAKVTAVKANKAGLTVTWLDAAGKEHTLTFDQMLSSVGRRPNSDRIGAEAAGIKLNEQGYIEVNHQLQTRVANIYAIGDIVGNPMLAHKATAEGHVVAEVIAGERVKFDARCIPSVAYTDPEVAWVGLTETEAKAAGIKVGKGVFPWLASGRSLGVGRSEGVTKILVDESNSRVIGAGIVGSHAGDLIAELALAIEMGCDIEDIALTIHPHPTFSETIGLAAEAYKGTITDLYLPKKRK